MATKNEPPAEEPKAPGLTACIDDVVARGGLTHAVVLELASLRQKIVEVRNAIMNFHNDVPPSLADAIDRAEVAL